LTGAYIPVNMNTTVVLLFVCHWNLSLAESGLD